MHVELDTWDDPLSFFFSSTYVQKRVCFKKREKRGKKEGRGKYNKSTEKSVCLVKLAYPET